MKRFLLVAVSVTILAVATPTPGNADQFSARIKAGTIQMVGGLSFLGTTAISGNHGLTFNARFDSAGTEAMCAPCQPGETISLSTSVASGDGTGTYRGQTYEFNFNNGGGFIVMGGPSFTLPPREGTAPTTVEFETPFTVLDQSHLFFQSGANGEIQTIVRLTGSGTATVRFQVFFEPQLGNHLYYFDSIRLDFSKPQKSNAG
jgi:hypothetical protein